MQGQDILHSKYTSARRGFQQQKTITDNIPSFNTILLQSQIGEMETFQENHSIYIKSLKLIIHFKPILLSEEILNSVPNYAFTKICLINSINFNATKGHLNLVPSSFLLSYAIFLLNFVALINL